ncbi:MAG: metal ABC transporter permease [Pseudomonadota bacterium]
MLTMLIDALARALGSFDFMVRAGLAAIGLALAAGPLGCFVLWRRLAYFGEATAHAALLGVALGLAWSLPAWLGALATAAVMALAVARFSASGRFAADGLLGVFAHAGLALGLVALSQIPNSRPDLIEATLFGQILTVSEGELILIWGGAALLGGALAWRWRPLLNATISPELARAEGGDPERERLLLTLGVAFCVAIAMQVVGLLLVTAMLLLPAAAARPLARTPERMAALAALIGVVGAVVGLQGAFHFDAPAGPSIVTAIFAAFLATTAGAALIGAARLERRA